MMCSVGTHVDRTCAYVYLIHMSGFQEESMSKSRNQHVVPTKDGWAVKSAGAPKATKVFDTQKQAIDAGRRIATNQRSELLIHGKDGRIREKNTYGRDPYPPKG